MYLICDFISRYNLCPEWLSGVSVADPGGPEARPLALLKLVKEKMAATAGRKFRESSGPPRTNSWICYCTVYIVLGGFRRQDIPQCKWSNCTILWSFLISPWKLFQSIIFLIKWYRSTQLYEYNDQATAQISWYNYIFVSVKRWKVGLWLFHQACPKVNPYHAERITHGISRSSRIFDGHWCDQLILLKARIRELLWDLGMAGSA